MGVSIEDYEGCPRYIGRLFRDVGIRPSPTWLRARLNAAGMRPISNVVDVTNYVMLGLGNPLHAFDFATLAGGEIVVRRAAPARRCGRWTGSSAASSLRPHDRRRGAGDRARRDHGRGGDRDLRGHVRRPCWRRRTSSRPRSGGRPSASACRPRARIAGRKAWTRTSRNAAATWATELMVDLTGARWVGHTDARAELPERPVVRFRPERANASVGLDVAPRSGTPWRLGLERRDAPLVPTWRARDLTREVDLSRRSRARARRRPVPRSPVRREMSGRLADCSGPPPRRGHARSAGAQRDLHLPRGGRCRPRRARASQADHRRAGRPAHEAPALARRGRPPQPEVGNERIALFEIARVYFPKGEGELPEERTHVAAIAGEAFLRLRRRRVAAGSAPCNGVVVSRESDLFHPGKAAAIEAGLVGELHPAELDGTWGVFEVDLEELPPPHAIRSSTRT